MNPQNQPNQLNNQAQPTTPSNFPMPQTPPATQAPQIPQSPQVTRPLAPQPTPATTPYPQPQPMQQAQTTAQPYPTQNPQPTNPQFGQVAQPSAPYNPQQAQPFQQFQQQPQQTQQSQQTQPAQPTPPPKVVENPISTQSTLLISELRDNLVIMKDGSFRAVVACQSINFDLMSETEREGVEYSYQDFLNSLNFTVQILVRSQKVDIGPYIERLATLRRDNENMLLGILMDDYINFIDVLSQEANIMDKSFFVVIPYYSSADAEKLVNQTKNLFRTFSRKAPEVTRINRDTYNKAVEELNNRVESVISGLFQIGIQAVRLRTRELSELYYNFNNPDTAVREPLVDFSKLATTYVRKGVK